MGRARWHLRQYRLVARSGSACSGAPPSIRPCGLCKVHRTRGHLETPASDSQAQAVGQHARQSFRRTRCLAGLAAPRPSHPDPTQSSRGSDGCGKLPPQESGLRTDRPFGTGARRRVRCSRCCLSRSGASSPAKVQVRPVARTFCTRSSYKSERGLHDQRAMAAGDKTCQTTALSTCPKLMSLCCWDAAAQAAVAARWKELRSQA